MSYKKLFIYLNVGLSKWHMHSVSISTTAATEAIAAFHKLSMKLDVFLFSCYKVNLYQLNSIMKWMNRTIYPHQWWVILNVWVWFLFVLKYWKKNNIFNRFIIVFAFVLFLVPIWLHDFSYNWIIKLPNPLVNKMNSDKLNTASQ